MTETGARRLNEDAKERRKDAMTLTGLVCLAGYLVLIYVLWRITDNEGE